MTNLNAAAIDAAVVAMKINAGFDETETDDDPIWREEAETAVSAYLAALPKPDDTAFEVALDAYNSEVQCIVAGRGDFPRFNEAYESLKRLCREAAR